MPTIWIIITFNLSSNFPVSKAFPISYELIEDSSGKTYTLHILSTLTWVIII